MQNPRIRNVESCIFRENFINSSYVSDNGITLYNAPTINKGMTLNGTTQYASLNEEFKYSFGDGTTDKAFSIEASFIMNDATNFCIASKGVYNTDDEWRLLITGSDKINWQLFDESVADCYIGRAYSTALTPLEGELVHVIATYDGTGTAAGCKIYLNGDVVDDADASNNGGAYVAMEKLGHVVQIGRDDTLYANGEFESVSIYDRALTGEEVINRYLEITFRRVDVRQLEFFLPLRTHYNNGTSELTDNIGVVGDDTIKWGDGSVVTTMPTLLPNNGASFDGGDRIQISAPIDINATFDIFSFGCLFNTSTAAGSMFLMDVRDDLAKGFGVYVSTGILTLFTDGAGAGRTLSTTVSVADGQWHSLFATIVPLAGSHVLSIYIDGELNATGTKTAFTTTAATPVIGNAYNFLTGWNGSIKFPFLWRVPLTPAQAKWEHEVLFRQFNL